MNYWEFMYSIEEDGESVLNLPENNITPTENNIGDVLEPWDEESCDDFFLGADPYIPLY